MPPLFGPKPFSIYFIASSIVVVHSSPKAIATFKNCNPSDVSFFFVFCLVFGSFSLCFFLFFLEKFSHLLLLSDLFFLSFL